MPLEEQTPLLDEQSTDVNHSHSSSHAPAASSNDYQTARTIAKKPTPLPKLQIFNLYYIQFGEPITATVIYPFVVQLVRDTGITGGSESKTGYYAGIIVSLLFPDQGHFFIQRTF